LKKGGEMKKFLVFLCSIVLVFEIVGISNADLIDLGITRDDKGTQTIYDDQYWIKDLNRFVGMTYDEQIAAIGNLDSQGLSNITSWHMATYSDILNLTNSYSWETIAGAFEPTTVGDDDYRHWVGRYDRVLFVSSNPNPPYTYHYEVNISSYNGGNYSGGINVGTADHEVFPGAFVTAYALPAPVPEPTTMLLLGTGIVGLFGFRRKFKK